MKKGIVTKSTGKFYTLREVGTNVRYQAVIRGKFKLQGYKLTNPLAVGDIVDFSIDKDDFGIVEHIHDRTNYVIRQSPRKKHYLHLLAANVDQALLLVTIVEPMLKQGFIDRFLMMTEPYDIPVHIVFNKGDLYSEDHVAIYAHFKEVYERINYQVSLISVQEEKGIERIKSSLKGKTTLVSGQSGVGKSSLISHLLPDQELRVNELSGYTGKGQHTTTFAEMFDLDDETRIIDTPGIKTLSFNHFEVMDVAHNFREIFQYSDDCKFNNCTHREEPSCAIKKAVEEGQISELRYLNYLQLVEEVENQNYWERIKDY